MYVQKTLSRTFELLRENPINIAVYFIPQLVFGAVFFALYLVAYAGLMFGSASIAPLFSGQAGTIVAVLAGILALAALVALIALSAFFALMFNRTAYLASKGTALQLSAACFSDLIRYAKSNFFAYFKNMIAVAVFSIIVIVIAAIPLLVLLLAPLLTMGMIPPILLLPLMAIFGIFLAIAYIFAIAVANTSMGMFFMGKESTGALELLKSSISLLRENIPEYALMILAYAALSIAFMAAYFATYMTFCLIPVALGLAVAYQFGLQVSIFVFLSNLISRK
ncbi:MAG: hypothetical protein WC488_01000 [Candidatus Micrarchaeia archaeon]